ncbi:trypsin eta [Ceratitis capitata]|uniref:trypsin eta n=1 Tax=Ceratitis capitata TaxID=7213 RepID=UPI0003297E1A|nr:trypsin eta [Ceratitis capitata]
MSVLPLALTVLLLLFLSNAAASSIQTPQFENRIVGGVDATILHHKHQISLRRKTCKECAYLHHCGGNILNEDTILTAAHCVGERVVDDFTVVAGTETRTGSNGLVARIEHIVVHEHYNASTTDYDVALLFLATPLLFDNVRIAAVSLVTTAPAVGAQATVTGWGTLSEGGVQAQQLQAVNVFVLDRSMCTAAYGGRFTAAMLCAGLPAGGKDACQRDSGGPLLVANQLAGIISWGVGCARAGNPGVYVNVAHVRTWITETVAANSLYE